MLPSLIAQLRTQARPLLIACIPALLVIGLVILLDARGVVPDTLLLMDPQELFDQFGDSRGFYGAVSNLGSLLWSASAAIGFFAARHTRPPIRRYLLAFSLLTTLIALDDVYLLHERQVAVWFHIPEPVVYILYVALMGGFVLWFLPVIQTTPYLLLLIALGWMGLSVLPDLIGGGISIAPAAEDYAKLLGIVTWLAYTVQTASAALSNPSQVPPPRDSMP